MPTCGEYSWGPPLEGEVSGVMKGRLPTVDDETYLMDTEVNPFLKPCADRRIARVTRDGTKAIQWPLRLPRAKACQLIGAAS